MSENKFMRINKDILLQGTLSPFEVYFPTSLDSQMELCLSKEEVITLNHMDFIEEKRSLYIKQHDKELYKNIAFTYEASLKRTPYEKKTHVVYAKATNVIEELFHNPETLGGNEKAKDVVDDLVQTILHDEYTIRSLMKIATHDYYTHTHSLNVSIYALSLGAYMKLTKEQLSELGESALLHDLGKSKIAVEIINKNGKLTDEEFTKMKKHPELGFHLAIAMGIKNKNILHGIRYHHEKMDGSGYPSKLKKQSIPLFARIVGLCDIFDALTSKRSYKEAMTTFEALSLIKTKMNNHVDLNLLNNMIKMFK